MATPTRKANRARTTLPRRAPRSKPTSTTVSPRAPRVFPYHWKRSKTNIIRWYHSCNTLSTLNVKVPDEMEGDIQEFLEEHPHYLNRSESVRDALQHLIDFPRLSARAWEDIRVSREQIDAGDTVALDDLE